MSFKKKNSYLIHFFYLSFLCIYSFFINYYYASLGSFPVDTFLHFDSSYRILNNEYPIRDFWIVSGLVVDFVQSFFFKFFGVNWFAYILHSSLFNLAISLTIYYFFLSLKLSKLKSLIYSISFATLSYTISGTPFVDLHATYFLLIATLIIINNLNTKKKLYLVFYCYSIFFKFSLKTSSSVLCYYCLQFYLIFLFLKKREL